MRKKLFGRLLSIVLSATLAFTPSMTAFAGEPGELPEQPEETVEQPEEDESLEAEPEEEVPSVPEETPEETPAPEVEEPAEEVPAPEEVVVDEAPVEEEAPELVGDDPAPTKVKVTVHYFNADGEEIDAAWNDPHHHETEADYTLASETDTTITVKAAKELADKPFYSEAWEVMSPSGSDITVSGNTVTVKAKKLSADTEVKLKVKYTAYKYVIDYKSSEGEGVTFGDNYPKTYTYSDSAPYILIPAAPTVDYKSSTWNLGDAYDSTKKLSVYPADKTKYMYQIDGTNDPAADAKLTFYANYTAASGFEFATEDYDYENNNSSATISSNKVTLNPATRDGYTFAGWFTDAALTNAVPKDAAPATTYTYTFAATDKTVTFYPKWTAVEYDVVFDKGISGDNPAVGFTTVTGLPTTPVKVIDGGAIVIQSEPVRPNFDFAGWKINGHSLEYDDEKEGFVYTASLSDLDGDNKFVFVPQWDNKLYPIDMRLQGGTNADANATIGSEEGLIYYSIDFEKPDTDNTNAVIKLVAPSKQDYDFVGWFTQDPTTAAFDDDSELPKVGSTWTYAVKPTDTEGLTFYAMFEREDSTDYATITYDIGAEGEEDSRKNDSRNPAEFKAIAGASFTFYAPGYDDDEYIFQGWEDVNDLGTITGSEYSGYTFTLSNEANIVALAKKDGVLLKAIWEKPSPAPEEEDVIGLYFNVNGNEYKNTRITSEYLQVGKKFIDEYDENYNRINMLPQTYANYKTGNTFTGWYLDEECTKLVKLGDVIKADMIGEAKDDPYQSEETGSITLYAGWKEITYTITFHRNQTKSDTTTESHSYTVSGDDWAKAIGDAFSYTTVDYATQRKIVKYSSSVPDMADVTVGTTGIDLTPAQIISAYETAAGFDRDYDAVAFDLYADYGASTLGTYTIKFNANIGTSAFDADDWADSDFEVAAVKDLVQYQDVAVGQAITLTGREFVRGGYTLQGWSTDGSQTVAYKPTDTLNLPNKKGTFVELTAVWKADGVYNIKLNLNGGKLGKGIKAPKKYSYNNPQVIPSDITRVGYSFLGWNTRSNGEGTYVTKVGKGGELQTGIAELYAVWQVNRYKISFETVGGTPIGTRTIRYDEKFSLKDNAITTKYGYTFKTWTTVVNGKEKKFGQKANVSKLSAIDGEEFRFTAVWAPNTYKITYSNVKGAKFATKSAAKYKADEADKVAITIPTKPGYTFAGYYVYAKYDKKTQLTSKITLTEVKGDTADPTKVTGYTFALGDYGDVELYAEWAPVSYTIQYKENEAATAVNIESNLWLTDTINFTNFAKDKVITKDSKKYTIKGFGFEENKQKYAINKTYKVETIVKDAKLEAGKTTIVLYPVVEAQKYYVTTSVKLGDETISTYYNYDPSKGITIKAPKYKGYSLPEATDTANYWKSNKGSATGDKPTYSINANGDITILKATDETMNGADFTITMTPDTYSVTLIPNAKDAKLNNVAIPEKGVVVFDSVTYCTDKTMKNFVPEREGYTFLGFSTVKNPKKNDYSKTLSVAGLKATKKNANVYAIWSARNVSVYYDTEGIVSNYNNEPVWLRAFDSSKLLGNYKSYGVGKAYTPAKPKLAAGYTFLGYKCNEVNSAIKTNKNGYVTKIDKTNNDTSITLIPVVKENSFKVSVNPNGGKYGTKKGTQLISSKAGIRFTAPLANYVTLATEGSVRPGYAIYGVNTAAKPKDLKTGWATTSDSIADLVADGNLAKTAKAVTLYPQWEVVGATAGTRIVATFTEGGPDYATDPNILTVTANVDNVDYDKDGDPSNNKYEIAYSSDEAFRYDVTLVNVTDDDLNVGKVISVGSKSAPLYVMIRQTYDGYEYKSIDGAWSDVITAAAPSKAAIAKITAKYVLFDTAHPAGLDITGDAFVMAVPGEKINSLQVPALSGYKTGDAWYTRTGAGTTADPYVYTAVADTVKVTGNAEYYTKTTGTEGITLTYDMGSITKNGEIIYMKDYVGSIAPVTFEVGQKWSEELLADPTTDADILKMFAFDGWYVGSDKIEKTSTAAISATNEKVTLTAHWTAKEYTVAFAAGTAPEGAAEGVTPAGTMESQKGTYGFTYRLPDSQFTCTGYMFDKWSLADGADESVWDGVERSKYAAIVVTAPLKDDKITATATYREPGDVAMTLWTRVQLKDGSYRTYDYSTKFTAKEGTKYSALNAEFNKLSWPSGYKRVDTKIYDRYYDYEYDDYEYIDITENPVSQNTKNIYVLLDPITYSVKYNYNYTGVEPVTVTGVTFNGMPASGDNLAKSATRIGYEFLGWTFDETFVEDRDDIIEAEDLLAGLDYEDGATVNLYAQWAPLTYRVKYYPGDGEGSVVTKTVTYGGTGADDKVVTEGFTKTGYKLKQWALNSSTSATKIKLEGEGSEVNNFTEEGNQLDSNGIARLFAEYEPIKYTIKYNANGGTGTVADQAVTYSEEKVTLKDSTGLTGPEGKTTFVEWNTKADGSGTPYKASAEVAQLSTEDGAEVNLYAIWAAAAVDITLNVGSGATVDPASMKLESGKTYADLLKKLNTVTTAKAGYTLDGWYKDAECSAANKITESSTGDTNKITTNATVYAKWTATALKVTFNTNGGTGSVPTDYTVTVGGKFAALTDAQKALVPTRTGYRLAGWTTTKNDDETLIIFGGDSATSVAVTEDFVVYALWTRQSTVTYNFEGATLTFGSGATAKVYSDSYVVTDDRGKDIAAFKFTETPVRTGYTFISWVDADGTAIPASEDVSTNLTYYAKWSVKVKFNPNGGKFSDESTDAKEATRIVGEAFGDADYTVTKADLTFKEWNTKADGTGTAYSATAKVSAPIEYFAIYSAKVTFNANGGTVAPSSAFVDATGKLASLPTPTRTGYTFKGWFTAETEGTQIALDKVYTVDTVIFAQWEAEKYAVTATLTNVNSNITSETKATFDSEFTATLAAVTGYTLPETVTVTIGGETVSAETDYTWNQGSGVLTIPAAKVTGAIAITAVGTEIKVTGLAADDTITIANNEDTKNVAVTATPETALKLGVTAAITGDNADCISIDAGLREANVTTFTISVVADKRGALEADGTATITFTSESDEAVTKAITVTIKAPEPETP